MRTIKFRAWDLKRKEFNDCLRMNLDGSKIEEDDYGNLPNLKNDIILMQFTGLKDKNDTDIYEGDIINYIRNVDETFNDTYWQEKGGCIIEWNEEFAGFEPFCIYRDEEYTKGKHCEVIGNIYENPELLK